jgi:hypothetical protein
MLLLGQKVLPVVRVCKNCGSIVPDFNVLEICELFSHRNGTYIPRNILVWNWLCCCNKFLILFSLSEMLSWMSIQMLMSGLVANVTYQSIFIMDTIFFWMWLHINVLGRTNSCEYVLLSSLWPSEEHFLSYFVSVDCRTELFFFMYECYKYFVNFSSVFH